MILSLALWIQSSAFFTAVRESWYVYPAIMILHLTAIALFGGMILIGNVRLLGMAMRRRPVSDVIDSLRVPKRIGFVMVATCGILLAGSKAEEYYYNPFFWAKMSLLVLIAIHGWIFRRSVYFNTAELDKAKQMPGRARLAAGLSLLLWTGVVICGRGIGYVEPPLNKLHASVLLDVDGHRVSSDAVHRQNDGHLAGAGQAARHV